MNILSALLDRGRLLEQLGGFDVEPGTSAAKIMDRLVCDGVAERARPRKEVIWCSLRCSLGKISSGFLRVR